MKRNISLVFKDDVKLNTGWPIRHPFKKDHWQFTYPDQPTICAAGYLPFVFTESGVYTLLPGEDMKINKYWKEGLGILGGKVASGDVSPLYTSMRECNEETGELKTKLIRLIHEQGSIDSVYLRESKYRLYFSSVQCNDLEELRIDYDQCFKGKASHDIDDKDFTRSARSFKWVKLEPRDKDWVFIRSETSKPIIINNDLLTPYANKYMLKFELREALVNILPTLKKIYSISHLK